MNRYLAIPLGLFLVGFAVTYFSQTEIGRSSLTSSSVFAATTSSPMITNTSSKVPPTPEPPKLMALNDAKVMVLDQWPNNSEYRMMSRALVFPPLYATLGELADATSGLEGSGSRSGKPKAVSGEDRDNIVENNQEQYSADRSSFLFTLNIFSMHGGLDGAPAGTSSFPVHVDRITQSTHIFADSSWQKYTSWRDRTLPIYKELGSKKKQSSKKIPELLLQAVSQGF